MGINVAIPRSNKKPISTCPKHAKSLLSIHYFSSGFPPAGKWEQESTSHPDVHVFGTIQVSWREPDLPPEATLLVRCKDVIWICDVVESESLQELRLAEERIIVIFIFRRRSDYSHIPKDRSTNTA